MKLRIQILFITANKHEQKAVQQKMTPFKPDYATQYIGQTNIYQIGYFGDYLVAHVHCKSQGSAAMPAIEEAYQLLQPKCAIMIGIAYGVGKEGNQNIGDILISNAVRSYSSVRQSTSPDGSSKVEDRNLTQTPGRIILNQFSEFPFYSKKNKKHVGTMLCGDELIDNDTYRKQLVEIQNSHVKILGGDPIIGGEMEGVSLASAFVSKDLHNWIVIKAICDFADGYKDHDKDKNQKLAAKNVVDYCFHVFKTDKIKNHIPYFDKKSKKLDPKCNDVTINAFYLFAARNNISYTLTRLAKETRIDEHELRHFENIGNINIPIFQKTTYKKMEKIRKKLGIGYELMNDETEDHFKFFFKNKGARYLCPVYDAKAVVFDFDGTLTIKKGDKTTWHMIWEHLGRIDGLNKRKDLHTRYKRCDLKYKTWCEKTAEYFKEKRLDENALLEISKKIKLAKDINKTLKILSSNNIPLYICSGSIDIIIENSLGSLKDFFSGISSNKFYMRDGYLDEIKGTEYDYKEKGTYIIDVVAKRENIENISDILFIGNSDNDEEVILSGAKTLLINPAQTSSDKKKWMYTLDRIDNLLEILPFVLPSKYSLNH